MSLSCPDPRKEIPTHTPAPYNAPYVSLSQQVGDAPPLDRATVRGPARHEEVVWFEDRYAIPITTTTPDEARIEDVLLLRRFLDRADID